MITTLETICGGVFGALCALVLCAEAPIYLCLLFLSMGAVELREYLDNRRDLKKRLMKKKK